MLNKINEINLEDSIIYDNLFPLFKSNNPYIDNESKNIKHTKTFLQIILISVLHF